MYNNFTQDVDQKPTVESQQIDDTTSTDQQQSSPECQKLLSKDSLSFTQPDEDQEDLDAVDWKRMWVETLLFSVQVSQLRKYINELLLTFNDTTISINDLLKFVHLLNVKRWEHCLKLLFDVGPAMNAVDLELSFFEIASIRLCCVMTSMMVRIFFHLELFIDDWVR